MDKKEQIEAYKKIRKETPPPPKVIPDKRRKIKDKDLRRELDGKE